jgi:hypothetical protein
VNENRYWSIEDCCWVTMPAREAVDATDVPAQRDDEPAVEPVEA